MPSPIQTLNLTHTHAECVYVMENRNWCTNHLRAVSVYCGKRLINEGDTERDKQRGRKKHACREGKKVIKRHRCIDGKTEGERDRGKREMVASQPQTYKQPTEYEKHPNMLNVLGVQFSGKASLSIH